MCDPPSERRAALFQLGLPWQRRFRTILVFSKAIAVRTSWAKPSTDVISVSKPRCKWASASRAASLVHYGKPASAALRWNSRKHSFSQHTLIGLRVNTDQKAGRIAPMSLFGGPIVKTFGCI